LLRLRIAGIWEVGVGTVLRPTEEALKGVAEHVLGDATPELSCKMPRQNHLLVVCLILVGLAVLVRTVAIGQRAYDVLLPPTSGDDRAPALAAVASGHTAELLTIIDTELLAPPVVR
jgi:hypothetical protein